MASNVRKAIFAVLAADSELGDLLATFEGVPAIFHRTAPQDSGFPVVIVSKHAGTPEYSFDDHYDEELWTVKAVDRAGSANVAEDIDERLRAVLQDAPLEIEDNYTLWFRRDSDVDYGEVEKGAMLHHIGAIYRLLKEPV